MKVDVIYNKIKSNITGLRIGIDNIKIQSGFDWDAYWASHLFGQDDLALWIKSRSGNIFIDDYGNNATILTQVACIDNLQMLSISPSHIFTTNSFAIEFVLNMEDDHTKVIVRQGNGTTASPGYEIGRTHIRLASNVIQFVNANPLINVIGQGWVHIFIFVNRKDDLIVYRNGVQTFSLDISAHYLESITNSTTHTLFSDAGTNNVQLAYYRTYDFGDTVSADILTNIESYAQSNYLTRDINAGLLSSCIGEYIACNDPAGTNVFFNTISDINQKMSLYQRSILLKYSEYGSLYNINNGYSRYQRVYTQSIPYKDRYVPLLRIGTKRTQNGTTLNYWQYINDIAGISDKLNVNDCRIRFQQDFFDRSNSTIWNDAARAVTFGKIYLTGTSGTATISINNLANTATFSTELITTAINFATACILDYKAIGINIYPSNNALLIETDEGVTITELSITNVILTLDGVATTWGHYDNTDPKVFHFDELNQRILMSYLNSGYAGRFYNKCASYLKEDYYASVEDIYKVSLDEIILYNSDKTLLNNKKVLTYTGDLKAAVLDENNNVTYENNYVKLGILSTTKPMFMIRLDDGMTGYEAWHALFDLYGLKPTMNITCGFDPVVTKGLLPWATVFQWYNEGWDISGSSLDDESMSAPLLTPEEVETNLLAIMALIKLRTGIDIKHFCPNRFGQSNLAVRYIAQKYFLTNHVGAYLAPEGANPLHVDLWNLSAMRTDGDAGDDYPFSFVGANRAIGKAAVKAQLDIAKAENRLAIIYVHSPTADLLVDYAEIIDYVVANEIDFVTPGEALQFMKYR